jgi:hypothetical protein
MNTFIKGDLVTHSCGSKHQEMNATFLRHIYSEDRVAVLYTEGYRKGRVGTWLLKYCIHRSDLEDGEVRITDNGARVTTTKTGFSVDFTGKEKEEEGESLPSQMAKQPTSDSDVLKFRGLSGGDVRPDKVTLDDKISASKKRTNDMYDKIRIANMTFPPVFEKKYGEPVSKDVSDWYNKKWPDSQIDHYQEMCKQFTSGGRMSGKAQMFKELYQGTFDSDVLRGTKAHSLILDEVADWNDLTKSGKHDDRMDALQFIAVDWAEGCNPYFKQHPEHTMKATIKELYTDGVLTQTLINDNDIDDMDASNFLHQIGNVQASLEKLEKHDQNSSKYVVQEVARLKKFIATVYVKLDAKFAEEA